MLKHLLHLLLLCCWVPSMAQNFTMNGTPVTSCSGSFFDPGGPSGNYGNNQSFTTTICSDGSEGTHIRLDFPGVALGAGDVLCFYDGNSTAANLLSCAADYTPGTSFVVQATAANPSGCLTVQFISDGTGVAAGWSAAISCVASCQQVQADLVTTLPLASPADTGWIDICPGQRVTFTGLGVYPQNDFAYHQSDLTTEFEWNFGDGAIAYGPEVSHKFNNSGGYYVQLFLKDTMGCRSSNLISQRIRVAPKPTFGIGNSFQSTICAGDTIQLSSGVNASANSNILVQPGMGGFSIDGTRSDSLPLPDGTGIPYETSLFFTEFSPGQVLTDINDLEGICVNMEHSWARDIEIKISCPNGTEVILHNHPGNTGSQVFLGIPNDNDNFSPIPGSGFDYCWTDDAPNPTWIQYANTVLGGSGTIPAGEYSTFDPLTDLIGCPLNGEWTLTVTDLWPIDNGFIFSWGINFNDLLYPNVETFSPSLVSWQWAPHPSIYYQTADSIAAAPHNAGTASYMFSVLDEFGCLWDTTVSVKVLPYTHPDCFECDVDYIALRDTALCVGSSVQLNGGPVNTAIPEVRFESAPGYPLGAANHPHGNPYSSPVAVNSLGYNVLTNPITQINSVCVDINTDFDADLYIYLKAPDNKQIELSTGNGGSGDNYKVTCFSPSALNAITTGTAPFNGTYKPEGNWSSLNNAQVNGDWKLIVSDGFGLNQYGKVNSWSIGFNLDNTVNYTWSSVNGLSCTNCPDPVATPTATTTYIMTATDHFNCVHKDTVTVTVGNFLPGPTGLAMSGMQNGNMVWTWNPVGGATAYEVNVNNNGWVVVNAPTYTVTGLNPGDMVNIEVRVSGGSVNCPPEIVTGSNVYFACTLSATLNATHPVTCPGGTDGSVEISANGAQGAASFFSSVSATPYASGTINPLPTGSHFAYIVDNVGCRDTVFFNITAPAAFNTNITATNVACAGGSTGALAVTASGGTGALAYTWQACAGGPISNGGSISGLAAGCYRLTVSDANGCSTTATKTITSNPALAFTTSQTAANCYNAANGSGTVNASGGQGPYSYLWSNGATTATALNLPAGFHSATITDGAGCMAVATVQVMQPALLVIDSVTVTPESCKTSNNGIAAVYASGGTPAYIYNWSNAAGTTQTVTALNEGNYNVTVTDQLGCTATGAAVITAPAALVFTAPTIVPEQCANGCNGAATLQVTGGIAPYGITWSSPNVPNNNLINNNLCPGSYQVTVTDVNNCTANLPVNITAATPIVLQFTPVAPSCPGKFDGQLTVQASGGTGTYQYTWSNNQATAIATQLTCATYTLTVTDGNNCTSTATNTLICPNALEVATISSNAVTCFGQNDGTATVTANGGTPPYAYLWNDPNQQNNNTATGLNQGSYIVTITDNVGCNITGTTTVTSPTALTATTSATAATCFGSSDGSVSVVASGGVAPYNYLWSNQAFSDQVGQLPSGTYSVVVTDQNNCTFTAPTATVNQPATPVQVTAQSTKTACYETPTGAALATASGSNGAPYSYLWSQNSTQPSAINLAKGTYTVTVTDPKGCTGTQVVQIAEYDSIVANIATIPPTCFGFANGQAAINLVEGGAGGGVLSNYSFQWGGAPNAPTGAYWGTIPGAVQISLVISDPQGCSGLVRLELPNPAEIVPAFSVKNITCSGKKDGEITITSNQGDNPITGYLWNTGVLTSSTANLQPGTYRVTLTDSKGCTGTGSANVTEPDPLSVQINATSVVCFGDANGSATATPAGGTPGYAFLWSNGNTTATTSQLASAFYLLTLTDANGCVLIDSTLVGSPLQPELAITAMAPDCYNTPKGRIEVQISGGNAPYQYSVNNGNYTGSPIFLALKSGDYTVQVKDNKGCLYQGAVIVAQPDPVVVSIDPTEAAVTYGDTLRLNAITTGTQGFVNFEWESVILEPFNCDNATGCASMAFLPSIENTVFVLATDEKGCTGTAEMHLTVDKPQEIYVPTGFTPNGDANNGLLNVFGKSRQVKTILSFKVFDRWGELVYSDTEIPINDLNRGWDGTFRGKDCEPGVFVWTLEAEYQDGSKKSFHGQTTLIR